LVSGDGKVLWTLSIGDRIVSDVVQVDFFNNGKLQYFFATQYSLHVIDRLGNYVNPYPQTLNSIDIEYVSVVDYDNSKKYRFLVTDKTGKIFMYDKEGMMLEGWNPNNAGGGLSAPAKHYRIKGKDYIVAARKDGVINLWTRRGEILRKFPVDILAQPVGDIFLERGTSLEDTYFVFVTLDGFRVRVTPEGKIQSKENLLKTSIRSTFSLTAEKSGKSYLLVQQDERQVTVADADGRKILSAGVVGTRPGDVRYFDYGSGKVFITIRDRAQGMYFVYDGQGNLLTTPPVETPILEIRPSDSDEFTLFFIHGKSLVNQPL
jgi:WD40 repeat protein